MNGLEKVVEESAEAAATRLEVGKPENYVVVNGKRFDFAEPVGAKFEMNGKYNELTIGVSFRVPGGVDTFERAREIANAVSEGGEG